MTVKDKTATRARARALARQLLDNADAKGWFEALYSEAAGDAYIIPWADRTPNPHLVGWLTNNAVKGEGRRTLVIGCGLGDDAEVLAALGFDVTAFDISPTAIAWCRQRFPVSPVQYVVADLFNAPKAWEGGFDLVVEAYTLQVLPPEFRLLAMDAIARCVAPSGLLLVIARGRDECEA